MKYSVTSLLFMLVLVTACAAVEGTDVKLTDEEIKSRIPRASWLSLTPLSKAMVVKYMMLGHINGAKSALQVVDSIEKESNTKNIPTEAIFKYCHQYYDMKTSDIILWIDMKYQNESEKRELLELVVDFVDWKNQSKREKEKKP